MSCTETLNVQLLRQLECPVCLETCLPPIYMCCNGHIVCAKCQAHLKECSTCHTPGKPAFRCLKLEKIAELLKLPCANRSHGCSLTFARDEPAKHLPSCGQGFLCRLCTAWKGSARDMKIHVRENHRRKYVECPASGCVASVTNIPTVEEFHNTTYYFMYGFNCDIFWLASEYNSTTRILTRTLRIVSDDDKDASRYSYSMEFRPKNEKRKYKVFHRADVLTDGQSGRNGCMEIFLPAYVVDSYEDGIIE